jgi:hypothetical protein
MAPPDRSRAAAARSRAGAGKRAPARRRWLAGALALAALPGGAAALEGRTDHRGTFGPSLEILFAHDTVAVSGQPAASAWRPALRIGFGFDATGDADEIFLGAQASPATDDPDETEPRLALDARYRGTFGTEAWKTYFEAGLWAPVAPRLAVGPLVGLGLLFDPSRAVGFHLSASFGTAFGEARIASFLASFGVQVRFE